jgi:hypothetical protein
VRGCCKRFLTVSRNLVTILGHRIAFHGRAPSQALGRSDIAARRRSPLNGLGDPIDSEFCVPIAHLLPKELPSGHAVGEDVRSSLRENERPFERESQICRHDLQTSERRFGAENCISWRSASDGEAKRIRIHELGDAKPRSGPPRLDTTFRFPAGAQQSYRKKVRPTFFFRVIISLGGGRAEVDFLLLPLPSQSNSQRLRERGGLAKLISSVPCSHGHAA